MTTGSCVALSIARDGRDCRAAVYHYLLPTGAGLPAWRYLFEVCMARITVEDCLSTIDNRFELSLAAAVRRASLQEGISLWSIQRSATSR